MTARVALAGAAVAALTALPAVPAAAAVGPACAVHLAAAAAGTARSCDTTNPGDTHSSAGLFRRNVAVSVATGSVTAHLRCWTPYRSWEQTIAVAGPGAGTISTWDDELCRLTVTATAAGTSAVATSTFSYTINPY